jgi:hypothetical protein
VKARVALLDDWDRVTREVAVKAAKLKSCIRISQQVVFKLTGDCKATHVWLSLSHEDRDVHLREKLAAPIRAKDADTITVDLRFDFSLVSR